MKSMTRMMAAVAAAVTLLAGAPMPAQGGGVGAETGPRRRGVGVPGTPHVLVKRLERIVDRLGDHDLDPGLRRELQTTVSQLKRAIERRRAGSATGRRGRAGGPRPSGVPRGRARGGRSDAPRAMESPPGAPRGVSGVPGPRGAGVGEAPAPRRRGGSGRFPRRGRAGLRFGPGATDAGPAPEPRRRRGRVDRRFPSPPRADRPEPAPGATASDVEPPAPPRDPRASGRRRGARGGSFGVATTPDPLRGGRGSRAGGRGVRIGGLRPPEARKPVDSSADEIQRLMNEVAEMRRLVKELRRAVEKRIK